MRTLSLCLLTLCVLPVRAGEPITLENLVSPGPNKPDEARAKKFSLDAAARFLDAAALDWGKKRDCFTCHTNYAYLYARPSVGSDVPALKEVRRQAEELVRNPYERKSERRSTESVGTAMALAFNDAATTGKLQPITRQAFEQMWKEQREDGGWDWKKCNWPPLENDDHYGVTLAALAVGVAPDNYAESEQAKKGMQGVRRYLKANPPTDLHHKLMLLWTASYLDDFVSEKEKKATIDEVRKLQKADGGWCLATLGAWIREDDLQQDLKTSDGYATAFVIYVLRRAGVQAKDEQVQKGVAWLKANQRESGRWFTRSLNNDSRHYISHTGTAFAIMALTLCGEK